MVQLSDRYVTTGKTVALTAEVAYHGGGSGSLLAASVYPAAVPLPLRLPVGTNACSRLQVSKQGRVGTPPPHWPHCSPTLLRALLGQSPDRVCVQGPEFISSFVRADRQTGGKQEGPGQMPCVDWACTMDALLPVRVPDCSQSTSFASTSNDRP